MSESIEVYHELRKWGASTGRGPQRAFEREADMDGRAVTADSNASDPSRKSRPTALRQSLKFREYPRDGASLCLDVGLANGAAKFLVLSMKKFSKFGAAHIGWIET